MQGIIRHISRRSGAIMKGGVAQSVRSFFQKGWSQPWISSSCRSISHSSEHIHAERIPIYKKIATFVKGTTFTFGGLTLAGFMGYPVDSRDSKNLRDLRSQLEAIRKQYPSVRSFPVYSAMLTITHIYRFDITVMTVLLWFHLDLQVMSSSFLY